MRFFIAESAKGAELGNLGLRKDLIVSGLDVFVLYFFYPLRSLRPLRFKPLILILNATVISNVKIE